MDKESISIEEVNEKINESLQKIVLSLVEEKNSFLIKAIKDALVELNKGNFEDGNWERVRRAIFILQNELDWLERKQDIIK